jgi:hypothetical protein
MDKSNFLGWVGAHISSGDWDVPQEIMDKVGNCVAKKITEQYKVDPPLQYGKDVKVNLHSNEPDEDYPDRTTCLLVYVNARFGTLDQKDAIKQAIFVTVTPFTITKRLEYMARVIGGDCINEYRKHCEINGIPFTLNV